MTRVMVAAGEFWIKANIWHLPNVCPASKGSPKPETHPIPSRNRDSHCQALGCSLPVQRPACQ
jgi:hypothetical protein